MIPISNWRAYWNSYENRLQGFDRVIHIAGEQDLMSEVKNMALDELFIAVAIPQYDSKSPDCDNYLDDASAMIFVLKKVDRKSLNQDELADILDETEAVLKGVRALMISDKGYDSEGGTIMRNLDINGMHTDPEYNYGGCYGWSVSMSLKDTQFTIVENLVIPVSPLIIYKNSPPALIRRHDFNAPYSFCGTAEHGKTDADFVWKITRINVVTGEKKSIINASWTDHLTANYS